MHDTSTTSARSEAFAQARRILAASSVGDVLATTCRELVATSGLAVAVAGFAWSGRLWQDGVHVAHIDGQQREVPRRAISATYAVVRRLAATRARLTLQRDADTAPLFDGIALDAAVSALHAFPIVRARKVTGVVLVGDRDAERVINGVAADTLEPLVACAATALESALKYAVARRDQERFLLLGEAIDAAMWDWDIATDEVWWSGGLYGVIGSGHDETGKERGKLACVHPDDARAVEASLAEALTSTRSTWTAEYRMRRADGTWAVVADRAYFLRDSASAAYRVIGLLQDVTQARRANEAQRFLVDATALLSQPKNIDAALDAVCRLAVERNVVDACEIVLFERATRTAARCVSHQAFGDGVPSLLPAAVHAVRSPRVDAVTLGGVAAAVVSAAIASSEAAPPAGVLAVAHRHGATAPAVGTTTGLVEELARRCAIALENARHLRAAEDAARAREEFLAIASHELRTPLTPLRLQLDLLARDIEGYARADKAPWVAQKIALARRQADRLGRLVAELLDISRLVGGALHFTPEEVDLEALTRSIIGELQASKRSPIEVSAATRVVGHWDRLRIEQVVINLLSNALKYGRGHPVRVTIDRVARDDGTARAVIRVRDEGIGIDPADHERIFNRFERAVSGNAFGGFGVGLFVVREIVRAMGGDVSVDSALGEGATFIVELPIT